MNTWLIPALACIGAILLVLGTVYAIAWRETRLAQRLKGLNRAAGEPEPARGEEGRFPAMTNLLERNGRSSALQEELDRSGLNWRAGEFAALGLAVLAALSIAGWVLFGPLGAAGGIVLATALPYLALKALQGRQLRRFEAQLPDALMLIASSLRSGYGIMRAIQAVREEMTPPISTEFGKVLDETKVGAELAEALRHLAHRIRLPDLDIAVTAILIQLDVGGNLAEVMEIVAGTVRERQRLRAEVDTLTAEGRLSGIILFLLPIVMAVIIGVLNRGYMSALFSTTLGHILIACAAVMQLLGGLVINRMLKFDF